jgi:glycosyltransferase involved in cell wall biosynthesis
LFIAPSRYFGDLMSKRLGLPPERVRVVYNGINLDGYKPRKQKTESRNTAAPVLGYFARMSREKGLETLVDAYILIKRRDRVPRLKLHIGGSCGPSDEIVVKEMRTKLAAAGCIGEVAFFPNLSRAEKLDFLSTLTVFSVPAGYGEAFGLYLIEAMAAGVPVVQPRVAAFPEIVEATGGGVLCEAHNAEALSEAIEQLLLDERRTRNLGEAGRKAVFENFTADAMAREMMRAFEATNPNPQSPAKAMRG